MKGKYCGHTVFEIPVSCFVPEALHTKDTAQAAAQKGGKKKRSLRDAPCTPDSSFFVDSHYSISYDIDNHQINKKNQQQYFNHGSLLILIFLIYLLHFHCTYLAGEAEEVDEAFCVMVVI